MVQTGAAERQIESDVEVEFHLAEGEDGVLLDKGRKVSLLQHGGQADAVNGNVVASDHQVHPARMEVERETETLSQPVEGRPGGQAEEIQGPIPWRDR